MSDDDRTFLQTLRDEREIRRVIQTYARGSDRRDFELMRSAYHPDAIDNHGPFVGNVDEYFEWAEQHHSRILSMLHLLSYPNIDLRGDVAFVETGCLLLQHLVGSAGPPPIPGHRVTMVCRYVDRFEKRDEEWKIAHRIVAYDSVRREWLHEEVAPDPIGQGFVVGRRSNDDIVYTMPRLPFPPPPQR